MEAIASPNQIRPIGPTESIQESSIDTKVAKPQETSQLLELLDQAKNLNENYKGQIDTLMAENEKLRKELDNKESEKETFLPTPSPSTEFQPFHSKLTGGIEILMLGKVLPPFDQPQRRTSKLSLTDLLADQTEEDEAKLLLTLHMHNSSSHSSSSSQSSSSVNSAATLAGPPKFPPRLMIDTGRHNQRTDLHSNSSFSARSMNYRTSPFQTPLSAYAQSSHPFTGSPMKKMRIEESIEPAHTCASCSSSKPFGYWVKDFRKDNTFYCQVCFAAKNPKFADIIVESTRTSKCESCERKVASGMLPSFDCLNCKAVYNAKPYRCASCHKDASNGAWYKDNTSQDGCLCQKCYHLRSKVKIDTIADGTCILRTCVNCSAPKSSSWYRDSNVPNAYICKHCYNHRYQARVDTNHDRKCGTCFVTHSSTWVKDPTRPGEYVCKKCYHQLDKFKMVLKADGTYGLRECTGCETTISSRWYKDQYHPGMYNCVRCYNQRKKSSSDSN